MDLYQDMKDKLRYLESLQRGFPANSYVYQWYGELQLEVLRSYNYKQQRTQPPFLWQ